MIQNIKGWRTIILHSTQLVLGLLTYAGVTVPDGMDVEVASAIETIVGLGFMVYGALGIGARVVTTTPVGKKE